ncbi:class I SAM-dependent methyltransferase [Nonomuraea sp. NBC_01738]|uniref:class I SAM-dependent methyltransferase n=1 Tax=Nonomuraea sp. NBC_01738 TaxID=2976003 RepID=UPI002E12480C|nr:class I SAM-dependent methyltransferase [Nonomuraea sp. NBC_01738]
MEQFHHPRPVWTGQRPTPERTRLLDALTGTVLELGAGDGLKLACYPAAVREIVLVEADPFLRASAAPAADQVAATVRILDGRPHELPVPDASCDAVVASLVLCCSPSVQGTLREVRRVLRPGGELRFYEHQRSANPVIACCQRLVSPVWSRAAGGCRPGRDTLAALRRAGFAVSVSASFPFHGIPHVLGTARPR